MNAKRLAWGLLSLLIAVGNAQAQTGAGSSEPPLNGSTAPASVMPQPVPTVVSNSGPAPTNGGYDVVGVSNWIRRNTPCCNSPFGRDPDIGSELYFRCGPSIPLGDGPLLSRNLATGVTAQIGLRTLFFTNDYSRAWTIDGGISNTFNSGIHNGDTINLPFGNNTTVPVTIRDVNRTFVNLGGGREWFFVPAKDNPAGWRFGVDGGARYGTMKASPNIATHLTDVIGGMYAGGHVMYECIVCDSIVNFGVRTEYSYTWSDVFSRPSDVSEINILFNVGVRY